MKKLAQVLGAVHGGLSLIVGMLLPQSGLEYFLGGILLISTILVTGLGFDFLISKKRIALGVAIIVSKYAVLGIICWRLSGWTAIQKIALIASFASIAVGLIVYTVAESFKEKRELHVV